ncbi:hypothetical protein LI192_07840, partial [Enterococcus avium]|uniref:hypothetical protein n=1 Tax=Enterococcus avium TaxID=33945 RepID=UPI001D08B59B
DLSKQKVLRSGFLLRFSYKKIGLKCIKYISTVTKIKESIICGAQIVSANPFLFKTAVKTNTN